MLIATTSALRRLTMTKLTKLDPPIKSVAELAKQLAGAYSTESYGGDWSACIKALRKRGYNDLQIEAILRSKWTRWAGDMVVTNTHRYGSFTAKDLLKFMDNSKIGLKEVEYMTKETFSIREGK
jgi:hypothetical protein